MNENQQAQGTPQEVTPESPVTDAQPVEVGPDPTLAAEPTDVAPETAEANDEDVEQALEHETADGPGFESEDELPESDFDGYATDEVEQDEQEEKDQA